LHHLAGGDAPGAIARYDELLGRLATLSLPPADASRARVTALVGRGAACLAADRAQDALRDLDAARALLTTTPAVAQPPSRTAASPPADRDAVRTYRALIAGMRAEAHRRLTHWDAATAAQSERRELVAARYHDAGADEDLLGLGEAENRLAEYESSRGRIQEAVRHELLALQAADKFSAKSGTEIHPLRMRVLQDLTTLRLREPGAKDPALEKKLKALLAVLAKQPNPAWSRDRARLEKDLASLILQRTDRD
jgi:hypothetical protein